MSIDRIFRKYNYRERPPNKNMIIMVCKRIEDLNKEGRFSVVDGKPVISREKIGIGKGEASHVFSALRNEGVIERWVRGKWLVDVEKLKEYLEED